MNRYAFKFWLIFAFAIVLALLFATSAAAQDANPPSPVTDDQVNAIAKQLYCPVCENIPLDVCPTQACAQWRALIREKLSQGWTEAQIKNYFVEQYGERVLAAPPPNGLNWLLYVFPPLAILAGAFILYRAMRAWKAPVSSPAASGLPADGPRDEYVERLEEELRRR
jgi:cytochrome c-type biogenesis protein CcmH